MPCGGPWVRNFLAGQDSVKSNRLLSAQRSPRADLRTKNHGRTKTATATMNTKPPYFMA